VSNEGRYRRFLEGLSIAPNLSPGEVGLGDGCSGETVGKGILKLSSALPFEDTAEFPPELRNAVDDGSPDKQRVDAEIRMD